MKKYLKGLMCRILILTILMSGIHIHAVNPVVQASTTNITVRSFIKKLIVAMDIKVDHSVSAPYITMALNKGILEKGDFNSYDSYLTRTDCAVILERADEYLHDDVLAEDLLNTIITKRISDINKIAKKKQEAVANIYGKGIIKGYNNGKCSQDREFRGKNLVTINSAKQFIKLTINKEERAKISPDGQLIRTNDLPKNADKFPYILASFPNDFYETKFCFERYDQWDMEAGRISGWKENEYYCYPVNLSKLKYNFFAEDLSEQLDMNLKQWVNKIESYMYNIFNVDYSTINEAWIKNVCDSCSTTNGTQPEELLKKYIATMKKYKTIIKTSNIVVEPSSFYVNISGFYMRVYVKYKVEANKLPKDLSEILYSASTYIPKLKISKWSEAYFDICLTTSNGYGADGKDVAVSFGSFLIYP